MFVKTSVANPDSFSSQLIKAAQERTKHSVRYDGSYVAISYPMGDVPLTQGVCTDLIIRAYRALGIDLQQLVHEDMREHFPKYPNIWGLHSTDTNIDHRRVPNLQTYFERQGEQLVISHKESDYKPGNLVTWMLPGNLPHIGIVSSEFVKNTQRPKIIHNIGRGPVEDDILFKYEITGHYYFEKLLNLN
ncbi:MAG: DUF1287 domain-containing protein [Pseudomonadota bacterium]